MKLLPVLFAAVLAVANCLAQAQVAPPAAQPAQVLPGSSNRGATEDDSSNPARDLPSDAKMLRDHLSGGGSAASSNSSNSANSPDDARAAANKAAAKPAASGSASKDPVSLADELGVTDAVKGVVKPIHQVISEAGVVQAVREIDASISGRSDASGQPTASGDARGPMDEKQRRASDAAAMLLLERFIDEVLPWLLGIGVVIGLGYSLLLWFKYQMNKQSRKSKQIRRAGKRRRSSSSSR